MKVESYEYKDHTITIEYDDSPDNPRDWDNLGVLSMYHRGYDFPNESGYNLDNYDSGDDLLKDVIKNERPALILPVFMYEHGGIALSTGGFSDPWDSGQIGFIFVRRADVLKEWNVKRISPKLYRTLVQNLEDEVETYSQYLNGEVYGYIVTGPDGEELDSCWGFYGFEYVKQKAEESADYYAEKTLKEQEELTRRLDSAAAQ
jgi:hypothetical protein